MRRVLAASLMALLLTTGSAFAADDAAPILAPAAAAAAASARQKTNVATAETFAPRYSEPRRPMVLPALYMGSALLQGYDAYSTLSVLKHGGREANPVMKGITQYPAAFIGVKAVVTVTSIMAAERMWKNHNRIGAIVTMAVSNGLMAYVAAHNSRVLNQCASLHDRGAPAPTPWADDCVRSCPGRSRDAEPIVGAESRRHLEGDAAIRPPPAQLKNRGCHFSTVGAPRPEAEPLRKIERTLAVIRYHLTVYAPACDAPC